MCVCVCVGGWTDCDKVMRDRTMSQCAVPGCSHYNRASEEAPVGSTSPTSIVMNLSVCGIAEHCKVVLKEALAV